MSDEQQSHDENHLVAERRAKLAALRARGIAFPNDFRRADHAGDLQAEFADAARWTGEALEAEGRKVALAGRFSPSGRLRCGPIRSWPARRSCSWGSG